MMNGTASRGQHGIAHRPSASRIAAVAAFSLRAIAFLLAGTSVMRSTPVAAQSQDVADREFAIWNAVFTSTNLSPGSLGPALWLDAHARRGDGGTVTIVRPGAGFRASSWLSLWLGYAWVASFADEETRTDEHRIWQQAILTTGARWNLSFQSRTRLEQRFSGDESGAGHRLRELVRVAWSPKAAPVGFVAWDEMFVGLNDVAWGPRAGYDQNRLFVGTALPISSKMRLEAGYLFVTLNRDPDRVTHALAVNFFSN